MAIGEIRRITSAELVMEFQPALFPRHRALSYAAYGVDQNHVTKLDLGGATTGSFALVVNGERTAALTLPLTASQEAEDIQSALEALPNVGTGGMTVADDSGSGAGPFTITAAGDLENEFLIIEIVDDTTGGSGVTQEIQTQGSRVYRLDADTKSFSYNYTQETTDVTGISDAERRHSSTVTDATFEISMYEAMQDYRGILMPGVEGYLTVYENGKYDGARYFAWEVLFQDGGSSFEQQEKVEIEISGRRQGADIARVGSIYHTS